MPVRLKLEERSTVVEPAGLSVAESNSTLGLFGKVIPLTVLLASREKL